MPMPSGMAQPNTTVRAMTTRMPTLKDTGIERGTSIPKPENIIAKPDNPFQKSKPAPIIQARPIAIRK